MWADQAAQGCSICGHSYGLGLRNGQDWTRLQYVLSLLRSRMGMDWPGKGTGTNRFTRGMSGGLPGWDRHTFVFMRDGAGGETDQAAAAISMCIGWYR